MDIFLEYPMSGYIKCVKKAVNAGNNIYVSIKKPKLKNRIGLTLTELGSDQQSISSTFNFFWRWFGSISFLTGHFYALSANYTVSHKNNEALLVAYTKQNT